MPDEERTPAAGGVPVDPPERGLPVSAIGPLKPNVDPVPPKREGWVLTGQWGDPHDEGWEWFAAAVDGYPCSPDGRPVDAVSDSPFGHGTFRFRLLKVPAPPDDGCVVTRFEEPGVGDRWLDACGGWSVAGADLSFTLAPCGPYPDGRRFIAEQEDRDDDRTRLAKAVWEHSSAGRYVHGPWGEAAPNNRTSSLLMADGLLALGVKAPDPVRLESL